MDPIALQEREREHGGQVPESVSTPNDVPQGATGGFGSLDAILDDISATYENYEVRLRPFARDILLMDSPTGDGHRRGRSPKAPPTHGST